MRVLALACLVLVGCRTHPAAVSAPDVALARSADLLAAVEVNGEEPIEGLTVHLADATGRAHDWRAEEAWLSFPGGRRSVWFQPEGAASPLPRVLGISVGDREYDLSTLPFPSLELVGTGPQGREAIIVDLRPIIRRRP